MSMKLLEQARIKAVDTVVGEHELDFYALAFSPEPDKQGDRIHPNALDAWLQRFYAAGKPLPISYHHSAILGDGAGDPFSVIGYAPADPEHVYVDDYGLRIRAILETEINDKSEQVYRMAKRGLLSGASAIFMSLVASEVPQADGSTLIMDIPFVKEAGPTLSPINEDAYVVAVKAEEELAELIKAWDGPAAMRTCNTAADFRSIAFELQNDSDPDSAAHWALPHHDSPGAGPNPGGVSAALGRLNQTGDTVRSKDEIRSHLEAHQPAERAAAVEDDQLERELLVKSAEVFAKAGRTYSRANETLIRQALELLMQALVPVTVVAEDTAKANDEEPARVKSEEPNAWVHERLAALDGS